MSTSDPMIRDGFHDRADLLLRFAKAALGAGIEPFPNAALMRQLRLAMEILGLTTLSISVPTLSLLGDNPNFLVAHNVSGGEMFLLALAIAAIPWAAIAFADLFAEKVGGRVGRYVGTLLRALLLGLIGLQALAKLIDLGLITGVIVWLVVAFFSYPLFSRARFPASVARVAGFAAPVAVFLFLFLSPSSALIASADQETRFVAQNSTPIVWVVFDQFPLTLLLDDQGQIERSRFPSLASLQLEATWYTGATTVSPETSVAVPAALSGRLPEADALPVVSQNPQNLFTLLSATHEITAYETFTQLCPDSVCLAHFAESQAGFGSDLWVVAMRSVLPQRVADAFVPKFDSSWAGFGSVDIGGIDIDVEGEASTAGEARARRVRGDDRKVVMDFLAGLEVSHGPTVHYLHLEKPHEPLILLPDGRRYDFCSCFELDESGRWPMSAMTDHRLQRYLMQAMYADSVLSRVIAAMKSSDLWDDAILVVMSDHGASLIPGTKNREVTADNAVEILPVPLFIRAPGSLPFGPDHTPVQLIDILPTVADLLGIDLPSEDIDGQSLVGGSLRDPTIHLVDGELRVWSEPVQTSQSQLRHWMVELIPDLANPFVFGTHGALFGELARPLISGESDYLIEMITQPRLPEASDTYSPSHVIAALTGPSGPVDVAVAADGVVAGLGRTFLNDGVWRVSVMLDPSLARSGSVISVYEVDSAGLKPIRPAR